jgi:hypothetical protein
MAMAGRLEGENLGGLLKDWLVAADPFTERPDKDAVARRGEALLTGLERCFAIAKGQGAEFLPDLVVITQRVRQRMSQIDGDMRSKSAQSVPHQMYVELSGTIKRSIDKTKDEVKETAKQVKDKPEEAIERWEETLGERNDNFERKDYIDDPYSFWKDMVDDVFAGSAYSGSKVPSCADDLKKLFASRDFAPQIKTLYDAMKNPRAKDYVSKVRDAAWPVQTTIDHYFVALLQSGSPGGSMSATRETTSLAACACCRTRFSSR